MEKLDSSTVAWIFLAIDFWDKDPVTRDEVVHSADAINHDVPSDREMDFAFAYLASRALIASEGHCYSITDAGKTILAGAHDGAGNIFDVLSSLRTALDFRNAV
jgi:hypothetical protein